MKQILVLQGNRNSGKDECVKNLNWLLNTPKFLHFYWIAKLFNFKTITHKWHITKYATPIKKILSIILGVPEERFEDRDFKENWYFSFSKHEFKNVLILDVSEYLTDKEFSKKLKKGNLDIILEYYLSVRQILQVFGTEVMRRFFGDKLWINITLSNNADRLIIGDQRFIVENEVAKYHNAKIIHINRPNIEISDHPSEKELVYLHEEKAYDILIENDGTLKDLFYKCKNVLKCLQDF